MLRRQQAPTRAATTYRGPASFSAPETQVVRDFVNSRVVGGVQQIKANIDFHTYDELVLWPYSYTLTDVPRRTCPRTITTPWQPWAGPWPRPTATPRSRRATSTLSTARINDWLFGVHGIFSYTFEMYPVSGHPAGFYPPDEVIPAETARNRAAILYLIEKAACLYAVIDKYEQYCGAPPPVNGTTTALASSPNPSDSGQSVKFTAAVASTGGVPVGTVTFTEGANVLASAVPVNAAGQAAFSTSTLAVGSHTLTAAFTGIAGWTNSSGDNSAAPQVVVSVPVQVTFTSGAGQDGWVLESTETSNVGGSIDATASTTSALRAGDDNKDKQYKAVVSFDTSSIPDGATILSVTLRLRRGTVSGTSPFTTHGTCWVDVQTGGFSGSTTLETSDFQAVATVAQTASLSNAASNGSWSEGNLNASGLAAINKTGTTQFRVYFNLDDNDDTGNDYIGYYSGEGTSANRPQLVVTYQ